MIREDRLQLNQRFVQVFKLLQERGDIILNDRNGKGMGDFAQKILGNRAYGHIVRAFLNEKDKRVLDYRHARAICREYGVNESFLIDGIGTPFGLDLPPQSAQGNYRNGNILFTSIQAFAGSGVDIGASNAETHEYFSIPGISGTGLVAFPVEGRSMEPIIRDGDTVVCRSISGVHEIKDNDMYAVKNNGSVWVKYVQRMMDGQNKHIQRLKLISANHMDFDPFEEDVNEHTRLFKVIRLISAI